MHGRARLLVILLLAAAIILPSAPMGAAQDGLPPIRPLEELKPGMRGVGRTVIQGQRVDQFEFEIVGLLRGGGGIINVKHLILFRMLGDMARRTGGSVAGMSGSPMYIDGRLIGALSASYRGQAPGQNLALATPIEEMLPLLDVQGERPVWPTAYTPLSPLTVDGQAVHRVAVASTAAAADRIAALPNTLAFVPATNVTLVRGLSPRAFRLLQRVLGENYPRPMVQAGGAKPGLKAERIRDGSSVGVEEVRGDIGFGGICTVTLRVGNRLLICGHPWEHRGGVSYALTSSEILQVVRTGELNFKEGNLGDLIGQIDLDRGQAIRGVLGQMPRMFAVRVTVTDADTGERVFKGAQVVRREDLVKLFTPLIALTAVDRARDQVAGAGTAAVTMTIRAAGLDGVITRENMFYSSLDVALAAMLDVPLAMQFLFSNPFAELDPIDINIKMTVTRKRQTAFITNVALEKREVNVGEALRVRITVRPHQEDQLTSRIIDVRIPPTFPRGPAVLVVGSGGLDTLDKRVDELLISQLLTEQEPFPGDDLEEAAFIFENLGLNNQILLQVLPFGLPTEGVDFTKFDVFAGRLLQTDWVIQGESRIPILVK